MLVAMGGGGMLSGWCAEYLCRVKRSGDRLCQVAIMACCPFLERLILCVHNSAYVNLQVLLLKLKYLMIHSESLAFFFLPYLLLDFL